VPVYSGKVVDGKVLVKGVMLPEGTKVMILVDDEDEEFFLTPDMHLELDKSIAQAERGETVPAEEVLEELRNRTKVLLEGARRKESRSRRTLGRRSGTPKTGGIATVWMHTEPSTMSFPGRSPR
jgi:hypothetical protein